jgi:hypothetical protein
MIARPTTITEVQHQLTALAYNCRNHGREIAKADQRACDMWLDSAEAIDAALRAIQRAAHAYRSVR